MRDADQEIEALLTAAQQAVQAGRWQVAKETFGTVVQRADVGEALFGLGVACWWLGETEIALKHWERAYGVFRRHSDAAQALLSAFYLSLAYRMSLGNEVASQGWLGRAASLVEQFDLGHLGGFVLVGRAYVATEAGQPEEGERYAKEAHDIARAAGDADLELCAMSELGAALVELGRVEEGVALLDEAMAGALAGEGGDLDTIVLVSCRTITSCARGGDFLRVTQWVRAADGFHERYGSPHLFTTCRVQYGSVLFATGDWPAAEEELRSALDIGHGAEPALHAEALAKLAELRLAQGLVDEAAALVAGHEGGPAVTYAIAAIRLALGEAPVAAALLRRRLQEVNEHSLLGADLLALLVEAELARSEFDEAMTLARRLAGLAADSDSASIGALGERALARVLHAIGDITAAVPHFERALAAFGSLRMVFEIARTRSSLARALAGIDEHTAIAEAKAALASFEALGATRDADETAGFLRTLGVRAARAGARGIATLTNRELEVLALLGEGLSNADIADRLYISRRTAEHHVASVLSKLHLRTRGEATAYALRHVGASRGSPTR